MRYIQRSTKEIRKSIEAFNNYYTLTRKYIERGLIKSCLDRGSFTHPRQILSKKYIDMLGPKRHRISIGYGPEAGVDILREQITIMENLKHKTTYTSDNVAIVAGAWCGLELVIEELATFIGGKHKKIKIAVIGPTYYQLFQRPIDILGIEIIAFDFVRFQGSTPQTKNEIKDILKCKPDIVFVTNPNNPVGEYFPSQLLKFLVETCASCNIFVVIDEMQNFMPIQETGLKYGKWIQSKNVIRVDSISKRYALAEYRMGWIIAHKKYIGNRHTGIISRTRGFMGNAPRAANDATLQLIYDEITKIKKGGDSLWAHSDNLIKKEAFIIRHFSKEPRVHVIPRDACFNLTIKVAGFPSDIALAQNLMKAGTMVMPCEGYGYQTKDTVMRITFAERWRKITHAIHTIQKVLNQKK